MASSTIINDAVQGETFVARQVFGCGRFARRANSLARLEQIESYAPGHQVRFRSFNYVAYIRGHLIFAGFETVVAAPGHPDDHDLNLSSGRIQEIAPVSAPALDPE